MLANIAGSHAPVTLRNRYEPGRRRVDRNDEDPPRISAPPMRNPILAPVPPLRHPMSKCPFCGSSASQSFTPRCRPWRMCRWTSRAASLWRWLGRSGCGKSTLLNLAGAMDFPTSGEVVLDGVVTSSLGEAALTRLAPREGRLHLPVVPIAGVAVGGGERRSCRCCSRGARRPREAALDRLRRVEMEDFAARMPYQLSGGQMQRVAIARALVHSPLCCWPTNPPATWTAPPET